MSSAITNAYTQIVAGLRGIGYNENLLEEGYRFSDWFAPDKAEREISAAAFGQTPASYESACIGVAIGNGEYSQALLNGYRALGAPLILEIRNDEISEWAISRIPDHHGLVERYPVNRISEMFAGRASDWRPQPLLRAKNIGSFRWSQQLGLFSGLLPELEHQIQDKLDPLLRDVLALARKAYFDDTKKEPDPAQLFKLVFWTLTAKVFHDRGVPGFTLLDPDSGRLLDAVAKHYKTDVPALLTREAQDAVAYRVWSSLDFRNLSVEVLSQIWSRTLVDENTRHRLGIYRTSRSIVRYIVERIPFEHSGDEQLTVLEPCSGSAAFLIGVMNVLRGNLFGMPPAERHKYFVQHLAAVELDPFGVEISKLALTLADFPNPDSWNVTQKDVFEPGALGPYLRRAGVVLCNPPFGEFSKEERTRIQVTSHIKPVELLHRILNDLHRSGVIGFVLPRSFIDGQSYAGIRKRLAERFATLDLTILPDRAFPDADSEIGLLVATDPILHLNCHVFSRKVNDDAADWEAFELRHDVPSEYSLDFVPEQAELSLAVPELPEVWDYLSSYQALDEVADLHRGIEWNQPLTKDGVETGFRSIAVRNEPMKDYRIGVAPQTKFNAYRCPELTYLSFRVEHQRGNAWQHDWAKPKAILNKAARSRGAWRMAAFPDSEGIACYQTYIGVWSKSDDLDEWLLSAILNSPVANAFVATREGKTDITIETLRCLPVPQLTNAQRETLKSLIRQYQAISQPVLGNAALEKEAEQMLMKIDALVLDGYRMPPRLERALLDRFPGSDQKGYMAHIRGIFPNRM